ncbi:hypothetical protein GCM10027570_04220 [Streptomonospora sediminis]
MPLNPADIRNKRFNTVRLRPGYNEDDVDALLDRVEATLAGLQGGPRTGAPLTAAEVEGSKFRTTRLSSGYDEDEVDAFLDVVAAELRQHGLDSAADAYWPRHHPAQPQPPHTMTPPGGPHPPGAPGPAGHPGPPAASRPGGGSGPPRHGVAPGPPGAPGPAGGPPPHPHPGTVGPPPPPPPAGPPPSARNGRRPLRPEDIRNQQFSTTRLTTGYNEDEVDAFLDTAEATLEALMHGMHERAALTAAEVDRARFSTTRARPGYDPAQVDAFLDFLAEEFRYYEETQGHR